MRSLLIKKPQAAVPPITPTWAWYDPSDLASLTVSGGLCSQMNDKSGNGRNVTASGAARPTSGSHTIGGLNVLGCSATDMRTGSLSAQAQPVTILAVAKADGTGTSNNWILGTSISALGLLILSNVWSLTSTTSLNSTTAPGTAAHVLTGIPNAGSSLLYLDGTQIASGNAGNAGVGSGDTLAIGTAASVPSGVPWKGDIGEILIYASALSSTNRAAAEAYLKAKWGTP